MTAKTAIFTVNGALFDQRPIEIGGFKFTAHDAVAVGNPSIKAWQTALAFAAGAHESSPYWIGSLVAYAESKKDWREKLSQAMSVTGLAEQTLHNLASVYRRVEEPERRLAQSVEHAKAVAPLTRPEQTSWLEKSRTQGWTVRELHADIRRVKRSAVIEGQAKTLHVVEVSVQVEVDAQNSYAAEEQAWAQVKGALVDGGLARAKVIAAHARGR